MIDTFFEGIVAVLNRLGIILTFMIFFLLCFSLLLDTCNDDIVNLTIKNMPVLVSSNRQL